MASVFKKRTMRPLPEGAEIITRKGERIARQKVRNGNTRTATVTTDGAGLASLILSGTSSTRSSQAHPT